MNVYIMRHGETDWNKEGLLQGSSDIPLNAYGIELAQKTKEGFVKDGIAFDKVYVSPYQRALKTAEIIISPSCLPIIVDDRIKEMNFGSSEGVKVAEIKTNPVYSEIKKCFDDPVFYEPNGDGESYPEVYARVQSFLTECILPLEGSCENVLIVCHGAVIRAFITLIKHMPLEDYWTIHQPNCCINLARVSKGKITMIEENRLYYERKIDPKRGFV